MQKNTSTILIAFLSGVIVAGGAVYVAKSTQGPPPVVAAQQMAETKPVEQVSPSAPPSLSPQEPIPDSRPTAATKPSPEVENAPSPQPTEGPKANPKPNRHRVTQRQESNEEESAQQPTTAATNQTPPPPAPATSEPVPPATQNAQIAQAVPSPQQPAGALYPPPGTQTAPPPPREPRQATIAAGTPIQIRINETLSTEKNSAGDTFSGTLDKPLIVSGAIIADRGSRVTGRVVSAEKAGRVKGVSNLSLTLTQIHTTDGQTVHVETAPWFQEGATSKKGDTAKVAGGAALGAIIGAIAGGGRGAAIGAGTGGAAGTGVVLTQRGKASVIPSETRLTFTLNNSVTVTEHLQ